MFKSYSAAIGSGNEIFTMGKNAYYEFLGACDIVDGEEVKGGCGRAEVALVFVACQTIGPKSSFNKKNALCRHQFLEAVVTLAGLKYINTKVVGTFAEAVEKILTEKVSGGSGILAWLTWPLTLASHPSPPPHGS
jgi:hypothetical protein